METTEIFRATVNSLITVFRCHLSLIKDKKKKRHPRRRRKQLQSGEEEAFLLMCGRNSAGNCHADSSLLENVWPLNKSLVAPVVVMKMPRLLYAPLSLAGSHLQLRRVDARVVSASFSSFHVLTGFVCTSVRVGGDRLLVSAFPLQDFLVNTGCRNFTGTFPLT